MNLNTVSKKSEILRETLEKVRSGKINFDPLKESFGFQNLHLLFPVAKDEIKGFPCVVYNGEKDAVKFGVKILPLDNKYVDKEHPCRIETRMLKEFRQLVLDNITPHVTFYYCDIDVGNKRKALTRFPLKGNEIRYL